MRILLVQPSLDPPDGGIWSRLRRVERNLA
jgi:hypothetical protein